MNYCVYVCNINLMKVNVLGFIVCTYMLYNKKKLRVFGIRGMR